MAERTEKLRDLIRSASGRRIRNMVWNMIERRLCVAKPRSYPTLLDVVLTRACNLNCTFCISSTVENERWLPYDVYQRIARKLFPWARNLSFCSGGEPLLYPRIRDALRLANSYRLKTTMVSNGMLLDADVCKWMLADQSLWQYFVSFDGVTKQTLERIRRGASFDKIVANVSNLARRKKEAKARLPRLGLRYSVMKQNAEELPGICALCKQMGVARVDVSLVNFANEMAPQDSLFFHQELAQEVFKETAARAKEHAVAVNLPPLPRDDDRERRCHQPWQFLQIETDGSIRFCYKAWIQTVGNFADGFERIWRGEVYQKIRSTLHGDSPYFPYCAFCCWRKGTNNEAAHNQKLHADAYTFGDNTARISFNKRSEENRISLQARKETAQESREEVAGELYKETADT